MSWHPCLGTPPPAVFTGPPEAYASRRLDDGSIISVVPLTFGRARLITGVDETGYDDGW